MAAKATGDLRDSTLSSSNHISTSADKAHSQASHRRSSARTEERASQEEVRWNDPETAKRLVLSLTPFDTLFQQVGGKSDAKIVPVSASSSTTETFKVSPLACA